MDFHETSITGNLFDETIENLLYQEDLLHHHLLPAFNLHTHIYIHIYTYMYVNVSDNYLLCQMQNNNWRST